MDDNNKEVSSKEVSSKDKLNGVIEKAKMAQEAFSSYSQEDVDIIFHMAAMAVNAQRIPLAKMAIAETNMGVLEDKVIKNQFASEFIYNKYADTKTCDVIERDESEGICKVAAPVGLICGIIPTTNPTSTAIFKALIALKTRNGIVISPHPRAKRCTVEALQILLQAAVEAGAPEGIVGWIDEPSLELTDHLMRHPDVSLILATGGPGMVKAAYSSGKPAIGVGSGNVPAIIDSDAHIKMAVSTILLSKTFDNGTICASEQSVIVLDDIYDTVRKEFTERGAHFLSDEEKDLLRKLVVVNDKINPDIAGQAATKIAEMAGISVAKETKVLIGEVELVGMEEPLSVEKLSPIISMYRVNSYDEALDKADRVVKFAGMGHTAILYTNPQNRSKITEFGKRMKTGRVLINMPGSQGAIGDVYNFKLEPSLTLGCGTWGGNSVGENVGVKHLMNIKTIAERRENMLWFQVPKKIFFKYGCLREALKDVSGHKRAFIVTDKHIYDLGYAKKVTDIIEDMGMDCKIFSGVLPDPDLAEINTALPLIENFQPDLIIALGGGSPIDAAKILWLLYEHPETRFADIAIRFMDIRKRICKLPELGSKAQLIAIPTTSGTGSEVTPFSVISDKSKNAKYPIADYAITPSMAIVDPEFAMLMPKGLTAASGIDAVSHGVEAMVSVAATDYTNGLALESLRLLFKYLPQSYKEGAKNARAREKVHYAATIAGLAFANAFLGLCHAMAHQLGAVFHIPHGVANALILPHIISYNASKTPSKQAAFPQYTYPYARKNYARITDYLNLLDGSPNQHTEEEKINALIKGIIKLKEELDLPKTIMECGITETVFRENLTSLSEKAFDDQCTLTNPRYALISEIGEIYVKLLDAECELLIPTEAAA